ncbi:MAG: serine hydrolase domain-containing protein [Myxococcales bacterium]|nr:beta-lactamase family protein [Polyangiaceae bacterium]MDW8251581.1 serine hydrolase domain-containing protein [Myxococcales bacterium]
MVTLLPAPAPAHGFYAEGFEPVARTFAMHLARGEELGAAFAAYCQGEAVVDLWGGVADPDTGLPWRQETTCLVFSVTKGLTAMAVHLLADRGKLDWDAPVASVWPGFAAAGKERISLRTLMNHQAGLPVLDETVCFEDCIQPKGRERLLGVLERQSPRWEPGRLQGYHAITFGMYAREVIERIAGESAGTLLRRELFEPLSAEVWVGTPPSEQERLATLVPPSASEHVGRMLWEALRGGSPEARLARAMLRPGSLVLRAFTNPSPGPEGPKRYLRPDAVGAELLWASATATARGLARAYLPFALGGVVDGRRFFSADSVRPLQERQGFSLCDEILQKPLGWSQGFLKEEEGIFSPNPRSFGHAGMGGALGWCDPDRGLSWGYVMNRMDWRIRSPRALALCRALYASYPLRRPPT